MAVSDSIRNVIILRQIIVPGWKSEINLYNR